MMITPTGIAISFGGSADGRTDSRPVVARIFGFAQGEEDGDPIIREMVVPAGQQAHEDLPHGIYNVQLRLPSGRVLQRNVTVDEDTNESYRFFEDFVPSEGFSLQESVGLSGEQLLTGAAAASIGATSANATPSVVGDVAQPSPRLMLHTGGRPAFETAPGWVDAELAADELRSNAALWRMAFESKKPPTEAQRRWAHVTLPGGAVEVASLPVPWYSHASGTFSVAEVLVDPARRPGAATTVAVRDGRLAGLLAFLDRGQASVARPLLEALERDDVIEEAISLKQGNPLAACAAAYVGLAVYDPREREIWDHWLGNCMNWFPDVPDAAIVHARRLILRPAGPQDNVDAAEALRRACRAGIPYFSAGVSLLREMLLVLSADFSDLAPLAEQAARLAGRVDPSQAFTVLRYPPVRKAAS